MKGLLGKEGTLTGEIIERSESVKAKPACLHLVMENGNYNSRKEEMKI